MNMGEWGMLRPEGHWRTCFVHFVNQADDVMAQHFQQDFVRLRDFRLGAHASRELALDGREHRFRVAALVILLQELGAVHLEVVKQAIPEGRIRIAIVRGLERHEWRGVQHRDRLEVVTRCVGLVRDNLLHVEVLAVFCTSPAGIGLSFWFLSVISTAVTTFVLTPMQA